MPSGPRAAHQTTNPFAGAKRDGAGEQRRDGCGTAEVGCNAHLEPKPARRALEIHVRHKDHIVDGGLDDVVDNGLRAAAGHGRDLAGHGRQCRDGAGFKGCA